MIAGLRFNCFALDTALVRPAEPARRASRGIA
jgi:hypothetical protein